MTDFPPNPEVQLAAFKQEITMLKTRLTDPTTQAIVVDYLTSEDMQSWQVFKTKVDEYMGKILTIEFEEQDDDGEAVLVVTSMGEADENQLLDLFKGAQTKEKEGQRNPFLVFLNTQSNNFISRIPYLGKEFPPDHDIKGISQYLYNQLFGREFQS